ncbi:hypothetical protein KEJ51_06975 [Candidatus Bathyarchaeota archaeon]|nr:hypothetical protein [Candidatus Bathyarchaeota archaeon]MBS7628997.1 hypothetical protein [Candidatus Bathyarchaeota archaeon]
MKVDKRGLAVLALTTIILSSSLIMYTPNFEKINIVEEFTNTLESSSAFQGPEELDESKLSTVRLKVILTDMGYPRLSNWGCLPPKPVPNAIISLSGRSAFTDWMGEAIVRAPQGNCTLAISRDRIGWWRTEVTIEKDMEEFEVNFILYRIAPLNITSDVKPSTGLNPVTLLFQIPDGGSYYIGMAVITYYTPSGEPEVYREDFSEALPLKSVRNLWGGMSSADHPFRSMVLIDYDHKGLGGETIKVKIDVKGEPVYVIPWMSYLPVESVVLERRS